MTNFSALVMHQGLRPSLALAAHEGTGEGGIRTLGSLLGYGALAKRCFRPLSHLTKRRARISLGIKLFQSAI